MNPSRAWRMPWLLRLSLLLHGLALAALLLAPQHWALCLLAIAFNHAVLTIAGLLPRCAWLGSNWTRLPAQSASRNEIALTIDDGPDPEVTPKLLALLAEHGVRATFFCIGEQALRNPDLCRQIVAQGHAVENHSQRHPHSFSLMGPAAMAREVAQAQRSLAAASGRVPRFFRAPAGLRNLFLDPVLFQAGLQLASWTRRAYDTRCGDADVVAARLLRDVRAGAILLLHDAHAARTASGVPVLLEVLPRLFAEARRKGLRWVTLEEALTGAGCADQGSAGLARASVTSTT